MASDLIQLKAGSTPTLRTILKDSSGNAVDITSYAKVSVKISANLSDTNAAALFYDSEDTTFTDPTNGIHDFIPSEDVTKLWAPGIYYWEVRWIDGSNVVTTTDPGKVEIVKSLHDVEA